ncbi:TPA: hypothetical protein MIW68_27575 [Klebsiella pneumoniae]|nr:hypothetical protein [Klebsiella pneumoniae]
MRLESREEGDQRVLIEISIFDEKNSHNVNIVITHSVYRDCNYDYRLDLARLLLWLHQPQ